MSQTITIRVRTPHGASLLSVYKEVADLMGLRPGQSISQEESMSVICANAKHGIARIRLIKPVADGEQNS